MIKKLFEKIEEYNTIIIHRHLRPDGDALGSQIGLAKALKYRYPNKEIYIVGDESKKYAFFGKMDEIEDEKYKNALVIICDVAVKFMVSDDRYKLAKEVFIIDHHKNDSDICQNHIVDTSRVACAEFITYLLLENGYTIPEDAATPLFGGIVTDSGRFLFGDNLEDTFKIASLLVSFGADTKYIYNNLNVESLADRKMKNYFSNKFEFKNKVAFLKNKKDVFESFKVEFNDISRGMLGVMAGISEIEIWLNFTEDENDNIIGEFRSREIPIVDIAKKYGGGGHLLACGATLKNWEMVDDVINDFIKLANMED